jgi:hypothetical protein
MEEDIINVNKETLETKVFRYGPDKAVKLNKELFLAEYNSLRSEILQRLSQQTTLYQIAITAWGVILGYALEKVDDETFNDVILIGVYPMLAFLISSAWAFNQTRIGQIAQYLRAREEDFSDSLGLIWWENYIKKEPGINEMDNSISEPFHRRRKIRPAIRIIIGTQVASIVIATIMVVIHFGHDSNRSSLIVPIIFIVVDIFITYLSFDELNKCIGK